MAEDGQKMSKSLGNVVSPKDVENQHGADVLRLWVVGSDYSEDLRIGPEILKQHSDIYRRLRNTLRFLLGNLNEFSDMERVPRGDMPELERWVLHRLWELDGELRKACDDYHFHPFFAELHHFCAVELSAFYFDIRKDRLYCDPMSSLDRRATRTVLDTLFDCLTAWLAPFICFTAEEAWLARHPDAKGSVHLRHFPEISQDWRDNNLASKWAILRRLRRVAMGALEVERANKRIGSSLQGHAIIHADPEYKAAADGMDLAEFLITSAADFADGPLPGIGFRLADIPGVEVRVEIARGEKCERCWKVLEDQGDNAAHSTVCRRCADAVETQLRAAE
jgi:isoleucyl-tRNA synthetase